MGRLPPSKTTIEKNHALIYKSPGGRRWDALRNRWVRIARALGMKFDNYVKTYLRRHLKKEGNVAQIVTETMVICELRENLLEHPADRDSPINPPYNDKINEDFFDEFGDAVEFQRGGLSRRRWKCTPPPLFTRANVPTVPDTFRLHENVIGPQVEGCSSRRADYVLKLLSPNADLLADGVIWFHIMDTEYWLHMFACLEIQKPRRRLLRAPKKKKQTPKAASGGFIPLKECPIIDAALLNRVLQRFVHAYVEMDAGRTSWRLQPMRGVIVRVFSLEERLIVLDEMREQDDFRLSNDFRDWIEEDSTITDAPVEADADDGPRRSARRRTRTHTLDDFEVPQTGALLS
jgi:hypothetical protein